jgi:hypothetical protein
LNWQPTCLFLWRGGQGQALSLECRLISAPRPPTHFCHKTFPGTSNDIFHRSKFQGTGCLISWLPKFRSFGLADWLSTFFSQNSALLNLNLYSSQTVYQADTSPTTVWCVRHVSCVPDMSLLALAYPWCPRYVSGVPDMSLVSQIKLGCLTSM